MKLFGLCGFPHCAGEPTQRVNSFAEISLELKGLLFKAGKCGRARRTFQSESFRLQAEQTEVCIG